MNYDGYYQKEGRILGVVVDLGKHSESKTGLVVVQDVDTMECASYTKEYLESGWKSHTAMTSARKEVKKWDTENEHQKRAENERKVRGGELQVDSKDGLPEENVKPDVDAHRDPITRAATMAYRPARIEDATTPSTQPENVTTEPQTAPEATPAAPVEKTDKQDIIESRDMKPVKVSKSDLNQAPKLPKY